MNTEETKTTTEPAESLAEINGERFKEKNHEIERLQGEVDAIKDAWWRLCSMSESFYGERLGFSPFLDWREECMNTATGDIPCSYGTDPAKDLDDLLPSGPKGES